MSHFLERLTYLSRRREAFAGGHGELRDEDRMWEEGYRQRWQHDKIVRSTHGVNCTGSCSWKIYVKSGVVTWETQQTDYPRTRPGMPNHEPRGCSRGASYSWYLYSASRIKYPMVRGRLVKAWREARKTLAPVEAWAAVVGNAETAKSYKSMRGRGGFVRSTWDEVSEIIAAANVHTIKTWGPDRVVGFSPIPAMSMVSYASGARYLSLIGGTLLSFYDWYCDLPPSSPQTWGEQTDVPESADWYNSAYIIAWGSNVPQTRTPDAHFFVEARYNGTKVVAITPDYAEVAKLSDLWLHPKQGTDAALAMAMGHVILREFFLDRQVPYFQDYTRRYTDMPMLVRLRQDGERFVPDRYVRQSDLPGAPGSSRAAWKTVATAEESGNLVVPLGSIGYRWPAAGEAQGRWNLEAKDGESGEDVRLALSLIDNRDDVVPVAFPYFGGKLHEHFPENDQGSDLLLRNVPVRRVALAGGDAHVATVFDLLCANYGLDRGLGGACATSFEDNVPYTPAWQEPITGVAADKAIAVARGFAETAEKTKGRSMVIIGAGMNHWYHQDMNYRGIINFLMMCGTVGVSGGGWAHYVGQEKLRPQTGWTMLAFALDWARPPRHMNGTSFFYAHSDQWRYEKLEVSELLSPLADPAPYRGSLIDLNVRAERMGWLPSAPQLAVNPLTLAAEADRAGVPAKDHVVEGLKTGRLRMACEDPDNPANYPRNLFIWRSNLFGSSGKGHEYFLRHFLGTSHGLQGKDLGEMGGVKPVEVVWRDPAPEGKLDLVVTLDFRMSTSCLYSDIVLPTATWYEKNDLNTSDMHPFIHPLSTAVDPVWEARNDWETYKTIAHRFSELAVGHLGVERDLVLTPIQHDTAAELAQPFDVADWKKGECDLIPGVTAPQIALVERDYPNTYRRYTALGPLADMLGNGGKGIGWNTEDEVRSLGDLNYRVNDGGPTDGRPRIETDIDAAEVILYLAPETNGEVAVKAWQALGKITGRDHAHLAKMREDEKIRFRDIQAQPRKIISSPTWSGIESEHVSYTAGYTNVHELIPWRTLTGRQQFYQDHRWFRDFGESLAVYRPPIDTRTIAGMLGKHGNGETEIVLNFITPHQKWGIHSTYTDNLLMLTLSRGGPIVWLSETDAKKAGIVDNDWIELFNLNGAIAARAVVSQRVHEGMCLMYHAQEKIVNVPGSQITGLRGGIHNSVTRTVLKPTHMVGGYAQLSYGFNYYGTVGSNRDEFVIVRKLNKVDWLDHSNPVDRALGETAS
jgi:nitrate reductase / nitrite oxidoreductase, alpha subunit